MLTLELIENFPDFFGLWDEWSCFAESLHDVTPFQLPDWLLTWWPHFGSGQLHVFVFRKHSGMVAIIPCFRHEWEGKRQITLIGSGLSDYLEPAVADELRAEVLQTLARELQMDQRWDVCSWQDLNANTPFRSLCSGDDFRLTTEEDMECAEIPLIGGFEQFWDQRPHGLRRNVQRYLRKAQAIDEPGFCVCAEPETELVNALITLHTARWQRHGEWGMIVRNRSALFLREVIERFGSHDMLRFFSLRFQGRIVAVICSFPYRNVLFSYLSAFDPEYEALGFGRILLYYSLRYAFEKGYASWNFLRGSEPYKFEWGARSIPKCRVIVTRSGEHQKCQRPADRARDSR